ncbi:hypothetical protein [Acidithiobacillus albertensis]|uniref:hypothetical protein n=1 Tax=Acidithiobacillus albertensis TaxID=119978 RepID=UPI001C07D96F|nr:hypothetical protein [Acidithiobacillus albertensis]MBU2740701.1 hypothetical protein [Acidithiobacillus albertensis]
MEIKAAAKGRQAHGLMAPGKTLVENLPPASDAGKSRDAIAEMAGISWRTIDKVRRVRDTAVPEVRERCEHEIRALPRDTNSP